MEKPRKYKSYSRYKESIVGSLPEAAGKDWENDGVWKLTKSHLPHILPVNYEDEDDPAVRRKKRAEAIRTCLGFDCKNCLGESLIGLHQYAHHLNSSQTLCMMFFHNLIDTTKGLRYIYPKKQLIDLLKEIGINIQGKAKCRFEYTEKGNVRYKFNLSDNESQVKEEYEGTTFDFHIKDDNVEVFFEIKYTENGFGKAKDDKRHREKAKQYIELLPSYLKEKLTSKGEDDSIKEILNHYQLFRNIIRAENDNKYVVFITDENNVSTEDEKKVFIDKYGQVGNVIFKTWQEIKGLFDINDLPYQFKTM